MIPRKYMSLCLLLPACMASVQGAGAEQSHTGGDGCAVLASIVYSALLDSAMQGGGGPGATTLRASPGTVAVCDAATRSVTRAFAAALRQQNIYVSWGYRSGVSGDYCLSHFLSQCYPGGDPRLPPISPGDAAYVAGRWLAVSESVQQATRVDAASDTVRFERLQLSRSIRRAIAATDFRVPAPFDGER